MADVVIADVIIDIVALGKVVPSGDGTLTILHEISFAVTSGEAVAIVGASGSGKSTLLGLMAGLDLPSSGAVILGGRDLAGLDEDARAELRGRLLGFVFQSFQLLPALTALENTMLPLELAGRADARATAEAMLARVGLGARPQLLLADEPTGNLDAATGAQIIELMFAMNAEAGTTLILVTHDEALAHRCGRTLRLSGGRLEG